LFSAKEHQQHGYVEQHGIQEFPSFDETRHFNIPQTNLITPLIPVGVFEMSSSPEYDVSTANGAGDFFAADAAQAERVAFIRRTYAHLVGAILALVGIEAFILSKPQIFVPLTRALMSNWWVVIIAFIAVSWVAQSWARSNASRGMQYLGLGLYTVAMAAILCPLLVMTIGVDGSGWHLVQTAAMLTAMIFLGLTVIVFTSKADFSFLRGILWVGMLAALGLAVASWMFGFSLGMVFIVAMIVLMSGYILYDTSNVLHHYHTDQHVAAALALFASVSTLFWYVLSFVNRD
jgi:hypothetical protein